MASKYNNINHYGHDDDEDGGYSAIWNPFCANFTQNFEGNT